MQSGHALIVLESGMLIIACVRHWQFAGVDVCENVLYYCQQGYQEGGISMKVSLQGLTPNISPNDCP